MLLSFTDMSVNFFFNKWISFSLYFRKCILFHCIHVYFVHKENIFYWNDIHCVKFLSLLRLIHFIGVLFSSYMEISNKHLYKKCYNIYSAKPKQNRLFIKNNNNNNDNDYKNSLQLIILTGRHTTFLGGEIVM